MAASVVTGIATIASVSTDEEKARIDRELIELLNELRVVLPGVQVLFAFLLILPFQQGFRATSDQDRVIYGIALLSSAVAAALLIAPSAYHRLNFRRRNKERMVFDSNRLILAGMLATGIGIACAIYLALDVVFGGTVAAPATAATVIVFVSLWLVLPLRRRREPDD
jgi:hypothetical protein